MGGREIVARVSAATFAPEGWLVCGTRCGSLLRLDPRGHGGGVVTYERQVWPARGVWSLAITPDGTLLAAVVGSKHGKKIVFLDARTFEVVGSLSERDWEEHRLHVSNVMSLSFAFWGGELLVASRNGMLTRWSVTTGRLITRFERPVADAYSSLLDAAWSPNGSHVVAVDGSEYLYQWTREGLPNKTIPCHTALWSVSYNPLGEYVAVAGGSFRVGLVNVWRGEFTGTLGKEGSPMRSLPGIQTVSWLDSVSVLARYSGKGLARFWRSGRYWEWGTGDVMRAFTHSSNHAWWAGDTGTYLLLFAAPC